MSDQKKIIEALNDAISAPKDFFTTDVPLDFDASILKIIKPEVGVTIGEYDVSDSIVCEIKNVAGELVNVVYFPTKPDKRIQYLIDFKPLGTYSIGKPVADQPVCLVRDLADGLALVKSGFKCVHIAFTADNSIIAARSLAEKYQVLVTTHLEYPDGQAPRDQLDTMLLRSIPNIHLIKHELSISMTCPPSVDAVVSELSYSIPHQKLPTPLIKAEPAKIEATAFAAWDYMTMLDEISLIYASDTVWDNRNRVQMRLSHLRHAVGNDVFKLWESSPARRIVKGLEFEPSGNIQPDHINLFFGLPERQEASVDKCKLILDHIKRLCGGRGGEFEWLIKWMAYPLQNLGAKMDSGVIMYGSEGPGKSIMWEHIIGRIYGEYSITIGQAQLESQFTGWMSRKLFAVCEEVVSRAERNQHKGQLKHMVTGKTIQVNEKNLPLREELNHLNSVFLSNSTIPLELDMGDRRYLVLYCGDVPDKAYFKALFKEINGDGVDAFYHYLMSIDLTYFDEHDRPPLNIDKERLIEASLTSPVLFFKEWERGDIDYPFISCTKGDLFTVYRRWCTQRNEFPKRDRDVTAELNRYLTDARKDIRFPSLLNEVKTTRLWVTPDDQKHVGASDYVKRIQDNCIKFNQRLTNKLDDERFNRD